MKRAICILPAIAAIAVGSMLGAAQDAKTAPQDTEAKPQMSMVVVEKVKPSMATQYEEATKELCALLTEHGADPSIVSFHTVSGPEIGYAFVIPLADGFNSMEPMHDGWMSAIESIGMERWQALAAKADACVESRAMVHTVFREDLSYTPENPALKQEDVNFIQYDFLYTFPGQEEAFEAIAKEWRKLYTSKGITSGWRVYQRITGDDLPVYMVAKAAASEADYHTNRAAIHEQLGEAAAALGEKSSKLIRKVESKSGQPRPDLSYPTTTEE